MSARIPDLVRSLELFLQRVPGVNAELPIVCTLKQVENIQDVTLQISVRDDVLGLIDCSSIS